MGKSVQDSSLSQLLDFIKIDKLLNSGKDSIVYDSHSLNMNKETTWYHTSLQRIKSNSFGGAIILGTSIDISNIKNVELKLKRSEERFKSVINQAPIPMMISEDDGTIIYVNNSWIEVSGYTISSIPTIRDLLNIGLTNIRDNIGSTTNNASILTKGEYELICFDQEVKNWD
nr:PAS domain S-box protein [Thiospirochaeta perfilievii]